jgi:hypothetical protein
MANQQAPNKQAPINLSELMQASQAAPVESVNFYKERNEAFASIAINAAQNTPETQIDAQEQQAAIAQQKATQTLSMIMDTRAKDMEAYGSYKAEFEPRSQDYDLLQSERRQNLATLTQEESDPEKNNIFLHPIKTIVSTFKSAQLKEKNAAVVNEMNALSDEMAQANKEYISVRQFNAEQLAFNLQTEVNLKSENALIAARQAEQSAALRYQDKQDDIAKLTTAASGLTAFDTQKDAIGKERMKKVPTDAELAVYRSTKLDTPYNAIVTDAERPQLLRALQSEAEDVQDSVSQLSLRYTGYIKEGKGSTETPTSFAQREVVTSVNGGYARGLDKLTQSRYSEIANIGLDLRVQQIAASARAGDMSALGAGEKANPALMKILGDSKNLADETALQLQIKGALEGDFSNSVNEGVKYIQQDMATVVSNRTATDPRPYVDPAAMSAVMGNSHYLVSNIPQQYFAGKDPAIVKAEADAVAKVSGMVGGNLASHKLLGANEFLKKLGVNSAPERVSIMQKWLQQSVMDAYAQRGAYSSLGGLAKISVAAKGEDFVIPLVTRESKGGGMFGLAPAMPSLDLSSAAGLATYIELAEKGVLQQASRVEASQKFQEQEKGKPTSRFFQPYQQ